MIYKCCIIVSKDKQLVTCLANVILSPKSLFIFRLTIIPIISLSTHIPMIIINRRQIWPILIILIHTIISTNLLITTIIVDNIISTIRHPAVGLVPAILLTALVIWHRQLVPRGVLVLVISIVQNVVVDAAYGFGDHHGLDHLHRVAGEAVVVNVRRWDVDAVVDVCYHICLELIL